MSFNLGKEYTQQQIFIIKQYLSKIPDITLTNPKQINEIIFDLHKNHNIELLRQDLQIFLSEISSKKKIIDNFKLEPPQIQPEIITPFFRQFAQSVKYQQPIYQKKPQKKPYVCKIKRKVKPTEPNTYKNLQEMVQSLDNNIGNCHILFQRKNRKNNAQKDTVGILQQQCLWIYNEFFYSILDRAFLKEQDMFKKILEEIRINPQTMTYYDNKALRLALPKPKLFSPQFIAGQIQKLNQYRNHIRSIPKHRSRNDELSVGRQVIAVHPVCGHIHSGSILAIYKQNQYMVKFTRLELGTQKILDINISLKQVNHPHKIIIENVNFQAMALTIKLLQYKADLTKLLAKYNNIAHDSQKQLSNLDNKFFQQYGWIGSTINILNLGIKHIISKFRVRGLDSTNQQKIGKNFAAVLINPLSLMEKQLDKSSENSDQNASNQIKKIISNHKESKVDQLTRELVIRYWNSHKQLQSSQKRQQFQPIFRCMIGILISLKVEHKDFSIEDNKYLKDLMSLYDDKFPEHFNEIYQLLTSITAKINEQQK